MLRVVATALLATCLVAVPGWYLGYHSLAAYFSFWLLNTLLLLNARALFRRFFWTDDPACAIVRVSVLVFALVVLCAFALGGTGFLTPTASAVALSVVLVLLSFAARRLGNSEVRSHDARPPAASPLFHPAVALVIPIVVLALSVGLTHPPVEYDSLTYHLFFPARWLQDHRITIIQTPFGEQAPAYAPSNAELFYLWLMLPFHGDLLARVGQIPFYLLTAAALFALARKLGASPAHAVYAAVFFLLARPVVEQAVGANVDLVFAACFVTTVYLGVIAGETGKRSDIVLWGASFGLWLGTKFIALAFCPVLLLFVLMRGLRWRSIWAAPSVAALALPWYVRNWVVAGSPLYPASLTFAGVTIGRGAFGREVMNNSGWQHLEGIGYVWTVLQRAFGADLLIMWLAFGAVGTATLALQRRWWPLTLGLLTPAAILGLFWFGIPYNNELSARYIFPAVALAMLMIPAAFRAKPLPGAVVHAALLGTILWLVIISSDALVGQHHIWLYVVLTIAAATSWRFFRRRAALSVLLLGVTCAATFVYSMTRCPGAGCDLIQMSAFNRPTMFEGWDWMEQHAAGAVIAYSGTNIPYRLLGPHFQNRVSYINIDRHFDWLYHDYARAERRNADYKPPDAPNPPYARQRGFREAWIQNLRRAEVDYFFVTRLSPLEIDNFRHNDAGFPEEDEWARADPQMFQLVFENPEVRIYAVHR